MASDRFHKAAKDGLLDVLKEASRKDVNCKDGDWMTPVLWAAFEGRLEALRLLCGRGGDPDKSDQFGNTALHLASAKGHLHCVDFLIKFGVNLYALDIDRHSAKDLAAINNRDDILRYLDSAAASFEVSDRKKARALRELAEKNCEKRMRAYMKRQQQRCQDEKDDYAELKLAAATPSGTGMLSTLKQKIWSSQGNLNKCNKEAPALSSATSTKFSELVGGSVSGGSVASRAASAQQKNLYDEAEGVDRGRRTIAASSAAAQQSANVLYVDTFSSTEEEGGARRGKISDVFEVSEDGDPLTSDPEDGGRQQQSNASSTLLRCKSQPNFMARQLDDGENFSTIATKTASKPTAEQQQLFLQRPGGSLFERPLMGGSIAFRRSVSAALSNLQPSVTPALGGEASGGGGASVSRSASAAKRAGGAKSRADRANFLNNNISDSDGDDDSDGGDGDDDDYSDEEQVGGGHGPIRRFLTVWGLQEYFAVFQKQQIDLDTLLLLTEADLKSLALPLGPFRKLAFAIQERRNALANPGVIQDSRL